MNSTRQPSTWLWVAGALLLVLVAGGAGYWLGAHRGPFFMHGFGFGFGGFGLLGLLLFALLVALVVGLIVAAITRETTTVETYEDWHRRAHAQDDTTAASGPAVGPSAVAPGARTDDKTVT